MNKPANLQDIIDAIEMQFDETRNFLNLKTGEVITVSVEALRAAEEEEPFDDLPDWQQEEIEIAIDVVENFENYKHLPMTYDINEYGMMENFCYELKNEEQQDGLLDAIRGRGAFRRFKDKVIYYGIEQEWYAFRDEQYKQVAINWCNDHEIQYRE